MNWIVHLDLAAFHAINGLAGDWLWDRLANDAQIDLIRGLPFVAPLWYFWSITGRLQERNRGTVIQVIVAVVIALVINRAMASLLPFRVRPMYDPASGFVPMSIAPVLNLENWSSFPSDTATFFCGLSTGAYLLSRRLGVALFLYAAVVVCLPRAYMGIHYPADLIAGALLGIATVKVLVRDSTRRLFLCDEILDWSRSHPGIFSVIFGLVTFEMITTFDDVRYLLHSPVTLVRHYGWPLLFIALMIGGLAFVVFFTVALRRRHAARAVPSTARRF